ncbi:OLC1v1003102C1 [Oldenlandia corymbosa var. corymbosa]|uniref:OLC1v1003102C1 n=1 Tax=Oldenlandia corymbosa var. corymbosa TaxID=529605 RepID=A0AAV1D9A1_OLDCO|nr:OLC1v1003102C1 [Oldenlandia corymbosa var. corymbosa]
MSSTSPDHHHHVQIPPPKKTLPLKEIPGAYGLPFFGAIKDRSDFYYNQGRDEFFKARMEKYNSTVFRSNMPPGPFMAPNPKVVVLLDAVSFPILFDNSKVEKRDVLDGTYMPSTKLFGGYRTCAFLDTSEPSHAALKTFFLSQLAKLHKNFVPFFRTSLSGFFTKLDDEFSQQGKANLNDLTDSVSFEFVFRLLCRNKNPSDSDTNNLGSSGPSRFDKWLFLQLAPLISLGQKFIPHFLEDLLIHTFQLPSLIVKSDYKKLYDAFNKYGGEILDEAEKKGIERDEALHNLIFLAGFNAYGGMKILFPALFKWVGAAGVELHRRLADEIRTVVKEEGGAISLSALEKMSLTKSVVYEALRLDPPVPFQYGNAREDIVINNHESSFLIKKGEMIFGYQTFATKDPKVFDNAEEFVPDRFVGDGEKLLKYLYWSNGRQTENPSADNKQCPAKDLVVLLSRIMLVEFFLKYDSFAVDAATVMLGPLVTIKSLTKAA